MRDRDFLTAPEAAEVLRLAVQTLAKWRVEGTGPPYLKIGRRVLYGRENLLEWARSRQRGHTGQTGEAAASVRAAGAGA